MYVINALMRCTVSRNILILHFMFFKVHTCCSSMFKIMYARWQCFHNFVIELKFPASNDHTYLSCIHRIYLWLLSLCHQIAQLENKKSSGLRRERERPHVKHFCLNSALPSALPLLSFTFYADRFHLVDVFVLL